MMRSAVMISCDMFQLLAPVLYLSRAFCLQPLKWEKSEYNYILRKSVICIIYSGIIVTACVGGSIYGLSHIYQLDVIKSIRIGNNTERYVTYADVGVVLIPSVVGVVTAAIKIENYLKFFDYLTECDFLLEKPLEKPYKYRFVAITTMALTCLILTFDMVLWTSLGAQAESTFVLIGYFCPYYISYFFTMVIELVYWQSVHLIKVRIICLNEELCCVGYENELFIRVDRKKINNIVDTLSGENMKKQNKTATTLVQVQDLIRVYQKLTEATNSVNDCFGLILLIIILGCLVHLLVTPYGLYCIIFNTGNSSFIALQSMWMTGHVLRLLLVVEPCHGCLIQSRNTSAMVCRLLCTETNPEIKKSLEFFLVYLSQCKIVFTAFGLTKIHRGLLTTIAGAVTTYLVILFQFNKS